MEKLVTGNGDPLQSYRNLFLVTFSMQAAGLLPTMWLWWVTRRDGAVKEPVTKESIGDSGNDICMFDTNTPIRGVIVQNAFKELMEKA